MKLDYNAWVWQSWFLEWLPDQIGHRLNGILFNLGIEGELDQKRTETKLRRIQKFFPSGWSVYCNPNGQGLYLEIPEETWGQALRDYGTKMNLKFYYKFHELEDNGNQTTNTQLD